MVSKVQPGRGLWMPLQRVQGIPSGAHPCLLGCRGGGVRVTPKCAAVAMALASTVVLRLRLQARCAAAALRVMLWPAQCDLPQVIELE